MTSFAFDIFFTLPEIYLSISSFLLLVYGVLLSVSKKKGYPLLANTFGLLSFQIIFFTLCSIAQFPYTNFFSWNYFLVSDFFVWGAKITLGLTTLFWIFLSKAYIIQEKINSFEYWILILLVILAFFLFYSLMIF